MKYFKRILIYSFLLVPFIGSTQNSQLKKGDKKFANGAYIDAIAIYEDVANNGYENVDLLQKLGDAYYFNADYSSAAKWYGKLFSKENNTASLSSFRYGQSLKAIGNYRDADVILKRFYKSQGFDYLDSEIYLNEIDSDRFMINSVAFNTLYSDYPAFYKDGILYVTSSNKTSIKNTWNNEPTSDVFILEGMQLKNLEGTINTKYNEGSIVITKNGNTMYYTRNDFTNKKLGKDDNNRTRLKLYRADKINGKWENEKELPFNSSDYSVGHPALSLDETKLYFVSDMPSYGNKGGTDIFVVEIYDNGGFGAPFNIERFNTVGNEMFPFIAKDSVFYFSSNGHSSIGGLDILMSKPNSEGVYGKVYNVGKPVNSLMDDFAFVMDSDTKMGYFASNRNGTQSDDIYSFKEKKPFEEPCIVNIEGIVRDKETGEIIDNALVSLIDTNNKMADNTVAIGGKYSFNNVDCKKVKFFRAEKNSYQTREKLLNATQNGIIKQDILLVPNINLSEGTDLGQILNPIYFDLDMHHIRPDAEVELQKIIAIMRKNPSLKIDVRSHTDSRSNDEYNKALSNKRVQSSINYIVTKGGIDRSRLTGKGYGEVQLLNGCSNGVDCTENEHQRNRRSEFVIKK